MQRQHIMRPQSAQDWDAQKATIATLYASHQLKNIIAIMEEEHGFKATENQYKKQISKWKLHTKRINDREYKAIIGKKRARENEQPGKKTGFRLRGVEVDDSKIERFCKRKRFEEDEEPENYMSSSELSCFTPSSNIGASPLVPKSPVDTPAFPSPSGHSQRLFHFEWFDAWGRYVDLSAHSTPKIMSDSILGLVQSLIHVIDDYDIDQMYSNVIRDTIQNECCSDCKWRKALEKASVIFQNEADEGRNRALISVILREGLHRSERLIRAQSPLSSHWWLASAALHVSEFYMLYEKYQEAQKILESLLELTEAGTYFDGHRRRMAMMDLALCHAHCKRDDDAIRLSSLSMGFPLKLDTPQITILANWCGACSRKLHKPCATESFQGQDYLAPGEYSDDPSNNLDPDIEDETELSTENGCGILIHVAAVTVANILDKRRRADSNSGEQALDYHCERLVPGGALPFNQWLLDRAVAPD